MPVPVVFSTGSLYPFGLDRVYTWAAEAGYDGVEIMMDDRWDTHQASYLDHLAERHGIKALAFHPPLRRGAWNLESQETLVRVARLARWLAQHIPGCDADLALQLVERLRAAGELGGTRTLGVYLNPRVRVGYNLAAYEATHPTGAAWVSTWDIFKGMWRNRIKRWTTVTFEGLVRARRLRAWEAEKHGNKEPGDFCLINEMQVLVDNGWAHV